jgi:hypothetical protein
VHLNSGRCRTDPHDRTKARRNHPPGLCI